jgi:hypothetical protein
VPFSAANLCRTFSKIPRSGSGTDLISALKAASSSAAAKNLRSDRAVSLAEGEKPVAARCRSL